MCLAGLCTARISLAYVSDFMESLADMMQQPEKERSNLAATRPLAKPQYRSIFKAMAKVAINDPLDDPPNMNTGEPWSDADDRDLKWMIKRSARISSMADFLCRTAKELRDRARELGFGELGPERAERSDVAARRFKQQQQD
jgi:hypothetical protein